MALTARPLQVSADGAYDQRKCYDAIHRRQAKATILRRKGAKIWQHGNSKAERHNRDENLRRIRKVGRKAWKHAHWLPSSVTCRNYNVSFQDDLWWQVALSKI